MRRSTELSVLPQVVLLGLKQIEQNIDMQMLLLTYQLSSVDLQTSTT
jgi:hypothetical protein